MFRDGEIWPIDAFLYSAEDKLAFAEKAGGVGLLEDVLRCCKELGVERYDDDGTPSIILFQGKKKIRMGQKHAVGRKQAGFLSRFIKFIRIRINTNRE